MAKYMLQLENKGAFVSEHNALEEAQEAGKAAVGKDLRWLDRPGDEMVSFQVLFKNAPYEHPVAVAYPTPDKPMFIWFDPRD